MCERERDIRRRDHPAERTADEISARGADRSLEYVPDEAQAREEQDEQPHLPRPNRLIRTVRPLRQQRQDDERHDREAHASTQFRVVDPMDEGMEPRLFDQQQHLDGDDAARDPGQTHPRQETGSDQENRRHFGGAVDLLPARSGVCRDRQCDRAGDEQRGNRGCFFGEPTGDASNRAEHRKRAHAGEARGRAVGVAGPLALDPDRGTTERCDQQASQILCSGDHVPLAVRRSVRRASSVPQRLAARRFPGHRIVRASRTIRKLSRVARCRGHRCRNSVEQRVGVEVSSCKCPRLPARITCTSTS